MNWKKPISIALGIFLGISLVLGVAAAPFFIFFYSMSRQMDIGRRYMDSLTEAEIQKWISRSKGYLANIDPEAYPVGARPVPADLQALKIRRVDVFTNAVCYVWCGGLDHTYLEVREKSAGSFEVVATYDDEHDKVIWPRKD